VGDEEGQEEEVGYLVNICFEKSSSSMVSRIVTVFIAEKQFQFVDQCVRQIRLIQSVDFFIPKKKITGTGER
jgi:virulence-associated protein VapD